MNQMIISTKKLLPVAIATLVSAGLAAQASAHTRFEVSSLDEGTRVYNNMIIGHGCGSLGVVGTSVVVPEGTDSSITVDGVAHEGALTDYVTNWGPNVQAIKDTTFPQMGVKLGSLSNPVGFWAGGEEVDHNLVMAIPFRINATNIEPTSCAVSVKFYVSIADVCQVTDAAGLNGTDVAGLWTHNNLGTVYDRVSETDNGPASFTITRNQETNPLPASCSAEEAVEVRPSAAQINRDMPIVVDGVQAWPTP